MTQKGFASPVLIGVIILLIAGVGLGIYLVQHPTFFNPKASQSTPCQASDPGSFKDCLNAAQIDPSINQIEVTKQIICTSKTECSNNFDNAGNNVGGFILKNRTQALTIFGTPRTNAGFKRTGNYDYILLQLGDFYSGPVADITLKDIVFDETTAECPYLKPGSSTNEQNPVCKSTMILGPQISNSSLDHVTLLHGKSHGIQVFEANNLTIKNSIIFDSGANGIWFSAAFPPQGCSSSTDPTVINLCGIDYPKANKNITIENNLIADSRVSAIEFYGVGTEQQPNVIRGNIFSHNHRDAMYIACPWAQAGVVGGHCPGGQLGVARSEWLVIEKNVVRDGVIDTVKPVDAFYPGPGEAGKTYHDLGLTSTGVELGVPLKNIFIKNNKIHNITGAGVVADFPDFNPPNENVNILQNVVYDVPDPIARPGGNGSLEGVPGYNLSGNILNTPSYPANIQKAFIFADPPICVPTSGRDCTSKIRWYSEGYNEPRVFVSGTTFSAGPNNSVDAPWINSTPVQFILCNSSSCSQSNSLSDIWVSAYQATPSQAPSPSPSPTTNPGSTGTISASANPCTISSGKYFCASRINWSTTNAKDPVQVKVRETGGILSQGPSGSQMTGDWIGETPIHIDLYEDNGRHLLNTIEVKGVTSQSTLTAEPNPCTISSGKYFCASRINWSTTNAKDPVQVKVRETGGILSQGPSGSQMTGDWVSESPLHIDLYEDNGRTLLRSIEIQGKAQVANITASPNPCILGSNGQCSSNIKLNVTGYPNLQIKLRDANKTPVTGLNVGSQASFPIPWINATGMTFDLYSNGVVIDSVFVQGINSNTVSPSPAVNPRLFISDIDKNGLVNLQDFNLFLQYFKASDQRVDVDHDTKVTVADFNMFLADFLQNRTI